MIRYENLTEEGKEIVKDLIKNKAEIPVNLRLEDYLKKYIRVVC